jgi:SAM-dependent methyltransferase
MWSGFQRVLKSYRCGSGVQARAELAAWYESPLGRNIAAIEQQALDESLGNLFGYYLLQLGAPLGKDLSAISRIPHRLCLVDCLLQRPDALVGAAAAPERLPVATGGIDVLLLPHVLAFTDEPHEVLREAERVLIPDGHLLVLGFNPWSWWGLWRLALGWRRRVPWCGRFLSPWKLQDWLALLGFEVQRLHLLDYRPPLRHAGLRARLGFLDAWGRRLWPALGGVYLLVAKKRTIPLTPIRPRWRPQRSLLAPGLQPLRKQSSASERQLENKA